MTFSRLRHDLYSDISDMVNKPINILIGSIYFWERELS